ncbi:MAG: TIGR03545 family protein [Gammaproteobacteria bacterium]
MKLIRWPGFIAFVVLLALLVGGTLLFAGTIIKSMVETGLSKMNGARVDIADVNIGYSPLFLELYDIQVADQQRPMLNTVQIGKAMFRLSFADLLLKKVVIDEMSLDKVELETPRTKSGALVRKKEKVEDKDESRFALDMPDIGLPDIKDVLQLEPLKTDQLIETLNTDLDSTSQNWQTIHDEVMNRARWDEYENRHTKIKEEFKGGSAQKLDAMKDSKALKKDLKQEVEKVRQAKQQFTTDSERLDAEYKLAINGPENDIKDIKKKYNVDNLNTSNITQMLFGVQAAQYVTTAQKWYQRVEPYLGDDEPEPEPVKRSQGVDISYKEFNPRPGFYVGKATLNVNTVRGQFEGNITDISSNQSINKMPTRFLLAGKDVRNRKSEKINGEINYINKGRGFVDVNYDIQAYKITDFVVSETSKAAIIIGNGIMNMKLHTRLQSGQLKGEANVDFSNMAFKASKADVDNSFMSMLSESLVDINRFNIHTIFSGSFNDMDMKIRSDLDNQLGSQLKVRFKQSVDQFENDLRASIEARYQSSFQKIESRRKQLRELKNKIDEKDNELRHKLSDLESRINQQTNLKEQEAKSKVDDKKDTLKDKLKSKLFN